MLKQVKKTLTEKKLVSPGQKIAVAVSGGPDSLCLLHVLHRLSAELDITLHLVHVNHGLRPEAKAEEIVLKKWALRLGLPLTVCRINVPAMRRKLHGSTQAVARLGRYRALLAAARRTGAAALATAHHLDDRVETMLLRLLAGSGTDGLKGIPLRRTVAGVDIIRPLYQVTRKEIEAYCHRHHLSPLTDPTNLKSVYLRNRIRLKLLPFLEAEFGHHVRRTLARTADILAGENELLQQLTDKVYRRLASGNRREGIILQLPLLTAQPEPLQARVLRRALWEAGAERVTAAHIRQAGAVLHSNSPSAWCTVSGDIHVCRQYDRLVLRDCPPAKQPAAQPVILPVPGKAYLPWCGEWLQAGFVLPHAGPFPPATARDAYLAADKLVFPLQVRPRRAGDRVRLFGRPGSRKLKDILVDAKIPRSKRETIPLVLSRDEIIWVPGIDIAECGRITAETQRILHLSLRCREKAEKDGVNHVAQDG
ncbi:MAG TPA: tRNA lysidine(34) synthetase TilS [Firmicutes bacterium]|nr:tRNA lysidine(34) synthetase TilS [Bacillota bacterium]